MSIFDDAHGRRSRGCPVCGEKNTMAVVVAARKYDDSRRAVGPQVARSVSMCSEHGEATFRALEKQLEEVRKSTVTA